MSPGGGWTPLGRGMSAPSPTRSGYPSSALSSYGRFERALLSWMQPDTAGGPGLTIVFQLILHPFLVYNIQQLRMGDGGEVYGRHGQELSGMMCFSLQGRIHTDAASTRGYWRSYRPNFSAIDTGICQHQQPNTLAASILASSSPEISHQSSLLQNGHAIIGNGIYKSLGPESQVRS